MEEFALANVHPKDPARNNAYVNNDGTRINFYVDPSKPKCVDEFTRLLNTGSKCSTVYYAYPRKYPVRVAIHVYADVSSDPDPLSSPSSSSSSDDDAPSSKRIRCTGNVAVMRTRVRELFLPLLEETEPDALVGCEILEEMKEDPAGVLPPRRVCRQAYFAFSNAWLSVGDMHKLRTLLEWHPDYKGKVSLSFGTNNAFPLPYYMPCSRHKQLPVTPALVSSIWQIATSNRAPTVRLSPIAHHAHCIAKRLIDTASQRADASERERAVFDVQPYGPDSAVDLSDPHLMCTEYLMSIFNSETPTRAVHYLNQFFADVYEQNVVYCKVLDELTKCVKLQPVKRNEMKRRYSFLNHESEGKDGKREKVNIIQFYLDFPQHALYDTTTFLPGEPSATVQPLARTVTHGDFYRKTARVLNTCPPAVYFMYKPQYGEDILTATRTPNMNADIERDYFGRQDDAQPLIDIIRSKQLAVAQRSKFDWEAQTLQEGPDTCLWVVLFHIWFVLCNRDKELFDRFNAFFARILVRPCDQDRQFLVLSGLMGAGKTNFINYLGTHLFGEGTLYQYCGGGSDRLVGKYTGQFENSVLVALDEATFRKDVTVQNALKSICTDRLRTTEQKFQESRLIRNFLHIVFMCNDPMGLPVEPGDRRYIFCECNKELAVTFAYHATVQPRFASRYCMMVYGRWLETQTRLHDNTCVNFFKSPPFTPIKRTCILNRMMDGMPELFWWHTCLNERKIRKLPHSRNTRTTYRSLVWTIHKQIARSLDVPVPKGCDDFNELQLAIQNKARTLPVTDRRRSLLSDATWKGIYEKCDGKEDKDWPVRVSVDDMYEAYKATSGKGNNAPSKYFISSFAESMQCCMTVKFVKNRDSALNPDAIAVKLPCLYGCRAQFQYFLKYKCVRDKELLYAADRYNPDDLPATSDETWVDILFEQARLEGRAPGFHRNCQRCRACSGLWREFEQKSSPASRGAEPAGARHPRRQVAGVQDSDQRLCAGGDGQGVRERGVHTPDRQPWASEDDHSDPAPDADMDGMQPGRTGSDADERARVQDQSPESDSSEGDA